ncbi:MAG: PilZ domain-containing protein [Candidatus Omnitrophica bacterium]|nr:PilZ domain-containing protein [Candidatus Omnitrophota bacterium]
MMDNQSNKRKFLRVAYDKALTYEVIDSSKEKIASNIITAISKNLSASGILFITNVTKVPEITSVLALDLDYSTANVCREIEEQALVLNDKIIGKVVRIEDNEDNTCGVGVAFIKKSDPLTKDIKDLLK